MQAKIYFMMVDAAAPQNPPRRRAVAVMFEDQTPTDEIPEVVVEACTTHGGGQASLMVGAAMLDVFAYDTVAKTFTQLLRGKPLIESDIVRREIAAAGVVNLVLMPRGQQPNASMIGKQSAADRGRSGSGAQNNTKSNAAMTPAAPTPSPPPAAGVRAPGATSAAAADYSPAVPVAATAVPSRGAGIPAESPAAPHALSNSGVPSSSLPSPADIFASIAKSCRSAMREARTGVDHWSTFPNAVPTQDQYLDLLRQELAQWTVCMKGHQSAASAARIEEASHQGELKRLKDDIGELQSSVVGLPAAKNKREELRAKLQLLREDVDRQTETEKILVARIAQLKAAANHSQARSRSTSVAGSAASSQQQQYGGGVNRPDESSGTTVSVFAKRPANTAATGAYPSPFIAAPTEESYVSFQTRSVHSMWGGVVEQQQAATPSLEAASLLLSESNAPVSSSTAPSSATDATTSGPSGGHAANDDIDEATFRYLPASLSLEVRQLLKIASSSSSKPPPPQTHPSHPQQHEAKLPSSSSSLVVSSSRNVETNQAASAPDRQWQRRDNGGSEQPRRDVVSSIAGAPTVVVPSLAPATWGSPSRPPMASAFRELADDMARFLEGNGGAADAQQRQLLLHRVHQLRQATEQHLHATMVPPPWM